LSAVLHRKLGFKGTRFIAVFVFFNGDTKSKSTTSALDALDEELRSQKRWHSLFFPPK
jgi:hypothetical protein